MVNSRLKDVPETMLWTLHNRATEALRKDGIIEDDKAIEIYKSIGYDYEKSFGKAEPSHALRSLKFDAELKTFLKNHPEGNIVNLGEGLETQRYRITNNKATWYTIDLPDAIAIREQFITPDNKHIHYNVSVLDEEWLHKIPKDIPVFITAQGLFMYFKEEEIKQLIKNITSYFSKGYLMFDTIPVWLSKKTMSKTGWQKTKYYTTPKMPWGINKNHIQTTLEKWSDKIIEVQEINYIHEFPRGISKWLFSIVSTIPGLKHKIPTGVKVEFTNTIN